jgi:hypothetical protein
MVLSVHSREVRERDEWMSKNQIHTEVTQDKSSPDKKGADMEKLPEIDQSNGTVASSFSSPSSLTLLLKLHCRASSLNQSSSWLKQTYISFLRRDTMQMCVVTTYCFDLAKKSEK